MWILSFYVESLTLDGFVRTADSQMAVAHLTQATIGALYPRDVTKKCGIYPCPLEFPKPIT